MKSIVSFRSHNPPCHELLADIRLFTNRKDGGGMTGLNSNTNRVYYLLQMKVKCDTEEAKSWIKNRSAQVTYELNEDKTISFEWFMSEDGNEATVAGRLDMYDWKTKTVIDLKSTKFVKWQIKKGFLPKLEHVLQVQCYDTMFSDFLPIENLNIVYVDNADIITYKVERRDLTEWIRTRIQEIENSVNGGKIPKGEASGLCQFCKYQTKCFNQGDGIEHKPLSTPKLEAKKK